MATPAPTTAIGYTQAPQYSQLAYEDETTPELQWPQSIIVYDQMRKTDSQVASVLRAVTLPVRRTPWRVDPNGARDEVVQLVADDLGLPIVGRQPEKLPRTKDRFSWSEHLRLALLMLPLGHSFFEQVYRVEDDGNRAHLRKLEWRPPKTIEDIEVASDGGLISIKQYWTQTNTAPMAIPVSRLVAYVHEKEGGNWLGSSVLRSAYKNWLLKDRLLRVQAQTIERNGMGIPVYEGAETERSLAAGMALTQSLRAGAAAGTAIPFGAKLRLMGVEGTLPDADPVVRYHDEQIARAVLAHFLNLGTQTGSWALGTTFADFFTLSLQTLAQQIADVATQHIIEDLVDVNFGEQEPAPRLVFDEIGSRQAATAQAIKLLVDAGLITPDQVLDETLRQQYGLPPADPATAKPPPAQAEPSRAPEPEPVPGEGSVAASAPVEAKFDPSQKRDGEGKWTDGGLPGGGALDKLKLGSRIQFGEGESLRSSRKFKSSDSNSWDLLTAEIDTPNGREIRLGVVDPDHKRHWTAGSTEKLYERIDEIDALLEDMDDGDDRFDALNGEREALAGQVGEGNSHSKTVTLDPDAVATLRRNVEAAEDSAVDWAHDWDVFWENNPSGDGDNSGRPDPKLAKGSIPTAGGDTLEWQVVGDGESDPASWRVEIGIRDLLDDDGWYIGRDGDATVFLEGDTEALFDGLAELSGSPVNASRRRASSRSYRRRAPARSGAMPAKRPVVAHGNHNQKDHGRRLPKAGNLGGDNPFAEFTRPQLRDAAKRRKIALDPRESRESIERKLAQHIAGDSDDARAPESAEKAILDAYGALPKWGSGWASLADLRDHLGSAERPEVDAALKGMSRRQEILLTPENDQSSLTPRQRAAAISLGGQPQYHFKPSNDGQADVDAASAPTATPTRMTEAQYTNILRQENARLHRLDGKSGSEAKSQPKASIDELKERNTALRKALRAKGVDYRTEEQKRADDEEKNRLLDEVERLAVAGGHDGPAKRAGASKMSKRELASFVADAKEFQRRQKSKQEAEGKGSSAVAAFKAAEDRSRATSRQVGYIKGLLRERGLSGEKSSEDIRKMSNAEARAYINRLLRGDY